MASIDIVGVNLRALIESKKEGKLSPRKVWVPKYCLVHDDKLKNEWSIVCINPQTGKNLVKGIQQGREQHNLFSKEMRLSSKGKMNSLGDGFIPPREKASERATHPRGRFIAPRENDAGRFKECSSRNRDFSLRGKFTPPHDKVVRKVTEGKFPRGGSRDRVVPLSKRFYQRI